MARSLSWRWREVVDQTSLSISGIRQYCVAPGNIDIGDTIVRTIVTGTYRCQPQQDLTWCIAYWGVAVTESPPPDPVTPYAAPTEWLWWEPIYAPNNPTAPVLGTIGCDSRTARRIGSTMETNYICFQQYQPLDGTSWYLAANIETLIMLAP